VIAVGGTALELAALVGIWHSVVHLAGSANLSKCQTLHVAPSATVPAVERSSSVSDISGVPLTMLKKYSRFRNGDGGGNVIVVNTATPMTQY
jgi:hypothetical protein